MLGSARAAAGASLDAQARIDVKFRPAGRVNDLDRNRSLPRLPFLLRVGVDAGGAIEQQVIEVNYPLTVAGVKVFLVGHGYAPEFIVRDGAGDVVFDDAVVFLPQDGNFTSTGVIKVPDSTPQLGFQGIFLPTSAIDDIRGPHSVFPEPDDPSEGN